MPATEGSPAVGTADLHGSTIAIETGKGEKTTFELVRLGTVKEFETVKDALGECRHKEDSFGVRIRDLEANLAASTEKLAAADEAYRAEKENGTALAVERGKQDSELALAIASLETARGQRAQMSELLDVTRESLEASLTDARAELDNLMSAKSSLEETNTALEVSEMKLCASQEAFDAAMTERNRYRQERDDTKAAFASLTDRHARCETDLVTADRAASESQAHFDTLRAQMVDFFEKERGGIDAVMQLLEKLSGE